MTDDRITGYSTENVAPLTPPDLELLGSLARQLPAGTHLAWDTTPLVPEPEPATCERLHPMLALLGNVIDCPVCLAGIATPMELTCPIRDCPGHEGPHGSLNAETWTSAGDCE